MSQLLIAYSRSSHRRKGAARPTIDMVWLYRSLTPVGRRGVFYLFKRFLPASRRLEEGGEESAPYGMYMRVFTIHIHLPPRLHCNQVDARLGSIYSRFFSLCDGNDWLSPNDLLKKILYFRKTAYSPVTYVWSLTAFLCIFAVSDGLHCSLEK